MNTPLTKLLIAGLFLFNSFFSLYANQQDSLRLLINSTEDDYTKADLLNKLSITYFDQDFEEAIRVANEALGIARVNNHEYLIIKSYTIIAYSYYFSNSSKALENYFLAIRHLKRTTDFTLLADTYLNVARIYNSLEKSKDAIYYSKMALSVLKTHPNLDTQVDCYFNLAKSYRIRKEYVRELQFLNKGIEIRKKYRQEDKLGMEYNRLGVSYWNVQKYDSAIKYFNCSLAYSINFNDSLGIARSLNNLGSTYCAKGQLSLAIECLKKAMKLHQSDIGVTYLELTNTYCKLNRLKQASYFFHLAHSNQADLKEQVKTCGLLIDAYERKNNKDEANYYLHLSGKIKDSLLTASIHNIEMTLKPRFEAEGLEAKIYERENNELLKENLALQEENFLYVSIAAIFLFIGLIFITVYLVRKQLERKKEKEARKKQEAELKDFEIMLLNTSKNVGDNFEAIRKLY